MIARYVLIEALCIVNIIIRLLNGAVSLVLIEALCIVNCKTPDASAWLSWVLIEALCIVNCRLSFKNISQAKF